MSRSCNRPLERGDCSKQHLTTLLFGSTGCISGDAGSRAVSNKRGLMLQLQMCHHQAVHLRQLLSSSNCGGVFLQGARVMVLILQLERLEAQLNHTRQITGAHRTLRVGRCDVTSVLAVVRTTTRTKDAPRARYAQRCQVCSQLTVAAREASSAQRCVANDASAQTRVSREHNGGLRAHLRRAARRAAFAMQTEGSEKLNPKRQQAEEARRMSPAAPFPCLQREAAVAALSARSTDSDEHQTRTMCWVLAAPPHSVQSAARPPARPRA